MPNKNRIEYKKYQKTDNSNRKTITSYPNVVAENTSCSSTVRKEKNITISGDSIIGGISKKEFNKQYQMDCIHSLARRIISTKYGQSAANVAVLNVSANVLAGKDGKKVPNENCGFNSEVGQKV